VFFDLILNHTIAVFLEALERRNLGRKDLVHHPAFLIPVIFKGSGCEIGFRLKGVVKTSLVDAGAVADVIDTDRTVTALPDESHCGVEEFLFGITLALHDRSLVDWLV
jgi:hypothetical protein